MTLLFFGEGGTGPAGVDWLRNSRPQGTGAGRQEAVRAARPGSSCQGGALGPARPGSGRGHVKATVLAGSQDLEAGLMTPTWSCLLG